MNGVVAVIGIKKNRSISQGSCKDRFFRAMRGLQVLCLQTGYEAAEVF